jgi:DNA uptake protein ComE-like DNA-binding protein
MTDILGIDKDLAKKLVEARPFARLEDLSERKLVEGNKLAVLKQRGAVVRSSRAHNLNTATKAHLVGAGIAPDRAEAIVRGAPFRSWADLDDFLGADEKSWQNLRKNFSLGEIPA